MPKSINNIHDVFIKKLLADKDMAKDFCDEFLPDEILNSILLDSIEPLNTSYIDDKLMSHFSDIVFRFKTNKKSLQVCILIEHKSYVDHNTSIQILHYLSSAYMTQIKSKQPFELIVPVLYYHGNKDWQFKEVKDLFSDYSKELIEYIPTFTTEKIMLNKVAIYDLLTMKNGILRAAMIAQQNNHNALMINSLISQIVDGLFESLDSNQFEFIFVYLTQIDKLDFEKLNNEIILSPTLNTKIMTYYDQLIEKGKLEGKLEGIEEGIEKGIEKIILNAFTNGIDLETIRLISGVSLEKINSILKNNGKF